MSPIKLAIVACAGIWVHASPANHVQVSGRMTTLVEVLRPALPFPEADVNGDVPVRGGEGARWFVLWPTPEDQRIVVRANPLHRDTQASGAEAMARIQEAVIAAERKAQAAYDRAIKELQESGKASNIDGVTLEDEGVAGERIDAELELTIVIEPATSYEIGSSRAPQVAAGVNGPTWTVTTPPNVFREGADATRRDRFRAAETRLVFADSASKPSVDRRGDRDVFAVTVPSSPTAFVVVLRGNEELLAQVIGKADWTKLRRTTP